MRFYKQSAYDPEKVIEAKKHLVDALKVYTKALYNLAEQFDLYDATNQALIELYDEIYGGEYPNFLPNESIDEAADNCEGFVYEAERLLRNR